MDEIFTLFILNLHSLTLKKILSTEIFDFNQLKINQDDILNNSPIIYDVISSFFSNNNEITLDNVIKAQDITKTILNSCQNNEIEIITPRNEIFPINLKNIKNSPPILFYKGHISAANNYTNVGIVGSRLPTPHGYQAARRFGEVMADNNIAVVSGLAKGCDSAAQDGCLSKSGITFAILANGLDTIYPKENTSLADRILEQNGCLISEYPPGAETNRFKFVKRNRLISALSKGIIVVEAALSSGTMHTVKFAKEQKRLIGVYEHSNKFQDLNQVSGNIKLLTTSDVIPLRYPESISNFIKLLKDKNIDSITPPNSEENLFNN